MTEKRVRTNRRTTAWAVLGIMLGVLLMHVCLSFIAVGLFYRFFYARYDVYCPTDLSVSDIRAATEAVSFEANGVSLSGLLIGDGQKGVIVMVHGMRSGMDAHFAEADYFAARGYTVFTYDGTGSRTSGGDSRCSISLARDDLNAALDYLETSAVSDLPVFLYGHSSGGYAAATALDRANATVAMCAFDDPIDTMCDTAKPYISFLVYLQRPLLALWNRIEAGDDANEAARDCINRSDAPILIIGASEDRVIPKADALYLHESDIIDPNAQYLEWAGDHSDLWLSPAALDYRERADGSIDRLLYNAVDPVFLDTVLAFFDAAVSN